MAARSRHYHTQAFWGLDSSIVLAALHQGEGGQILCVNERVENMPEADEFAFAAITAARWGDRLEAWTTDPIGVDYARLLDVELQAKPSLADLGFADRAALSFAESCAGTTLTSGQGGDQIFQRGRAPLLVADAIRDGVSAAEIVSVARHAAYLSRTHIWEVLGQGVRYAPRWVRFDPIARESFPAPVATAAGASRAEEMRRAHVWLKQSVGLSPVRRSRILRIIDLAFYAQPSVLSPRTIAAPVLASRPILACAHAIAPYIMIDGGVDRGLARRAFSDCVAPEVLSRTLKGATTRFHTSVLERNRGFMREALLDGRLMAEGLVQAEALKAALAQHWAADGALNSNLINCLAAEMWLRRVDSLRPGLRAANHLGVS
ncbi:MAG: asparagine synthase-related protein [Hyphomonadaceae bacterium JAD_PAG50586_4]|nr:MAG: asparagine synthase-related protein [Hyphomonadaceae bacterium JAD_PAG50586_4]